MDTEIRVSTESSPWRRKFFRHSSRDSNPRPFDHESGALTTELSPLPGIRLYMYIISITNYCSNYYNFIKFIVWERKRSQSEFEPF